MIYTRLAVTPSEPARRDAVSAALFAAGAEGLIEEGASFVTVFEDDAFAQAAERAARVADADAHTSRNAFDPGDWNAEWRRGVRANRVGRFVVTPPWLPAGDDAIVIDPGLGFGTGEHESTRLALALLQQVVRAGDVVADVGTGSGVLAIAAARLGASRVTGIEIDADSLGNAAENVGANRVSDHVSLVAGDGAVLLPLLAPVRVIAANIIASVLREMLPVFRRSLARDGDVIVAGILLAERDGFVAAADDLGWRVAAELHEGEWWAGHLRRTAE